MTVSMLGCLLPQRSSDSGYSEGGRTRNYKLKSSSDRSTPAARPPTFSDNSRLQNLENSLSTKKEVEQYSKALPWFKNEEERLDFLSRGNFEEKQKWLNEKSFLARPQSVTSEMRELVEAQDIMVGMPQSLVKRSWGEPDLIEVAGNPSFRNEKWRYSRYVSTSDGYKPEKRIVYFEGGKVVGWEME